MRDADVNDVLSASDIDTVHELLSIAAFSTKVLSSGHMEDNVLACKQTLMVTTCITKTTDNHVNSEVDGIEYDQGG